MTEKKCKRKGKNIPGVRSTPYIPVLKINFPRAVCQSAQLD